GLADSLEDEGLRDEIQRLLPITGAWSEAAEALLLAVEKAEGINNETAREVCERAAVFLRDNAGDAEGAERALLRAHKFAPENDEVLEQIEALQTAPGREASLLETLRKRANLSVDEGSKTELLRRCRVLAEGLGKNEIAEEVLREILESDSDDKDALEGLTYVRKAAGDDVETYSLLARRIDLESDPDKLRVLKFESAVLARDKLAKVEEAIELLEGLSEETPDDSEIAEALRQAYEKGQRWEELGALIAKRMDSAEDSAERANLKVGLAKLRKEQF